VVIGSPRCSERDRSTYENLPLVGHRKDPDIVWVDAERGLRDCDVRVIRAELDGRQRRPAAFHPAKARVDPEEQVIAANLDQVAVVASVADPEFKPGFVDRVLSREINPEIVKLINELGGQAKGFAGTDIFTCRKLLLDAPGGGKMDAGYLGEVIGVNTKPLIECIEQGVTPVISPTARGEDGHVYNCNADVSAAHAAIALAAKRLVFMSDVPGLMRNPQDPSTLIQHLQTSEVPGLKQAGIVDKGMIPKVDSAVTAIKSGVEKVSFVDGRVPHAVLLEIFTDEGVGTEVVL